MSQGFVNPYTYATSAPTITTYTSGSGTYTTPAGVKFLQVIMCGGGGGGAGSGTGGGTGGTGGSTTFGTATAAGGAGGVNNNTVGGAGGAPTTGSIVGTAITGATGDGPFTADVNSVYPKGGMGGVTPLGGAGAGSGGSAAGAGGNAIANTGSGGGGAGGARAAIFGGAGGGAGAYICGTIASPAATYSYSIGSGGTAGTAGTSGQAGGAGGSGVIYVYEYYEVLGIPTTLTLPLPVANGGTGLSSAGPAFSAYAASSQSITANTLTLVTLGTELFDTNNNFASSRFTPTVAGYYQINGIVRGTGTTMTLLQASIYKNGSAYNNVQINTNTPSYNTQACISEVIYLNGTTDYVELYGAVYCASGASFNYVDSAVTSHFNGCYLRGA